MLKYLFVKLKPHFNVLLESEKYKNKWNEDKWKARKNGKVEIGCWYDKIENYSCFLRWHAISGFDFIMGLDKVQLHISLNCFGKEKDKMLIRNELKNEGN